MTRERAVYILENKILGGGFRYAFDGPGCRGAAGGAAYADGITRDEDECIRAVWFRMPGWASYYFAVCEIANGRR